MPCDAGEGDVGREIHIGPAGDESHGIELAGKRMRSREAGELRGQQRPDVPREIVPGQGFRDEGKTSRSSGRTDTVRLIRGPRGRTFDRPA